MVDQHKTKPTLRLPPELKAAVQRVLDDLPERDEPWTVNDAVVAAMAMLVKRPKTFLRELEPFKPPRRRGRPRREAQSGTQK